MGGCGLCCPSVPVTDVEVNKIIKHMKFKGTRSEFVKKYMGVRHCKRGLYTGTQKREKGDFDYYRCIFLTKDDLCSIYPVRPKICRDYKCEECEKKFKEVG